MSRFTEMDPEMLTVEAPRESRNCGTGAGGFQPGNNCAKGGDGIPDVSDLEHEDDLGGSTGAALMTDHNGKRYVVKQGNSPEHIESENLADRLYEAMGAPVPAGRMSVGSDGQPAKVAEYIEGTPLAHLTGEAKQAAYAKLREHFVADALLANWDVIGLAQDNIIVSNDGTPYRIDNGGSLKFRAQGAAKEYGPGVSEIDTLRKSNQGRPVFGTVTDSDISRQLADIVSRKPAIEKAAASRPDIRDMVLRRIDTLVRREQTIQRAAKVLAEFQRRNCGTGAGGFQPGNNCAKGGDGAESFIDGHIGSVEADAAYKSLFVSKNKQPSDLLRAAGWNGGHGALAPLDGSFSTFRDSLTEDQGRAFAGSVAGVARAMQEHPGLRDLKVFASDVKNEQAKILGKYQTQYLPNTTGEYPRLTIEEYNEALNDELKQATNVPGFYSTRDDTITLVAGTVLTNQMQESNFIFAAQSSPSPLHVGYHESMHAAHYRQLREDFALPRTGPLSPMDYLTFEDRNVAKVKEVIANPPAAIATPGWRGRLEEKIGTYGATNLDETVAEYNTGVALGAVKKSQELDDLMRAYSAPVPKAPAARGRKTAELERNRKV